MVVAHLRINLVKQGGNKLFNNFDCLLNFLYSSLHRSTAHFFILR